jgi:hypothetical protein
VPLVSAWGIRELENLCSHSAENALTTNPPFFFLKLSRKTALAGLQRGPKSKKEQVLARRNETMQ